MAVAIAAAFAGLGAKAANGPAPSPSNVPQHDGRTIPLGQTLQWPTESSAEPSSQDWQEALPVEPTRAIGPRSQRCRLRRVREWVSIRCLDTAVSALTQLGGTQTGIRFYLDEPGVDRLPREGVTVFPLRHGDRRVLSLWTLGPGYDGPMTTIAGVIMQAEWLGEHPVLVLHDALNEPVRTAHGERRKEEDEHYGLDVW